MMPELRVGAEVLLEAKRVKGSFKVLEADWLGSTFNDDWFIDIQAEAL
jgi:hypothetical protein